MKRFMLALCAMALSFSAVPAFAGSGSDTVSQSDAVAGSSAQSVGIGTLDLGSDGEPVARFHPNPASYASPGNLFVHPGPALNSQVSSMYWRMADFCKGSLPVSVAQNPRHEQIVDVREKGISVHFVPEGGYVTGAPKFVHVAVKETILSYDIPSGRKFYCLGTLFLTTAKDESVATITNIAALKARARQFMATKLSGFQQVYGVITRRSTGYEREVVSQGRGVSVAPQGAGYVGTALTGIIGGIAGSNSKSGMYERVGAVIALFAPAPDQECCTAAMSVGFN